MTRGQKTATILSFLVGAGVGAAAALIFAPKSGEDFRSDIAEGVTGGIKQARSVGKDLKRRAQKIVDVARNQVEDALDAGDQAYSQAKKA